MTAVATPADVLHRPVISASILDKRLMSQMLLRYVLLFLNVFMAASVEPVELEPGWDPRHQHGPHIGRTYGILSPTHAEDGVISHDYKPFVVVYQDGNNYRVVRMDKVEAPGARSAIEFYGLNGQMESRDRKELESLYIFPRERHEVNGDPEIMRRWLWDFTIMSEDGLEHLISAINGFVDGWDIRHRGWPQPGGVYWLRPRYLGLKYGVHVPCVFLYIHRQDKSRVVRMAELGAPVSGARLASEFLGNAVKLETFDVTIDFTTFYIFPREEHFIKTSPQIMQIWNWHFIKIPDEGLERLMAASDGLVHGWSGSHGPQVRRVYWMLPRDLGLKPAHGSYIPCVVIDLDGNKCRIVCMFVGPTKGGKRATTFFGNDSHLETHNGKVGLSIYFLVPSKILKVQANPEIMQIWDGKPVTDMSPDGMRDLEKILH